MDPVYLYFTSFLQLSVDRACTHLLDGVSADGNHDAERYDVLVQREAERRGVDKGLVGT